MLIVQLSIVKGIPGIYGTIYKIEKILEQNDHISEDKSRCLIYDREYTVGDLIKEENLYKIKIYGVSITYKR